MHSTTDLPSKAGSAVEEKGQVLDKTFLKSIPTVVCWDGEGDQRDHAIPQTRNDEDDEGSAGSEDEIWTKMPAIGDLSDSEKTGRSSKRRKATHVPVTEQ